MWNDAAYIERLLQKEWKMISVLQVLKMLSFLSEEQAKTLGGEMVMKTCYPSDHIKVSGFKLPSSFPVVSTRSRVVLVFNHIVKTYVMDDSCFYKTIPMRVKKTLVSKSVNCRCLGRCYLRTFT